MLTPPENKEEMIAKQNAAAMQEFESRMASAGMVMPKPPPGPARSRKRRSK